MKPFPAQAKKSPAPKQQATASTTTSAFRETTRNMKPRFGRPVPTPPRPLDAVGSPHGGLGQEQGRRYRALAHHPGVGPDRRRLTRRPRCRHGRLGQEAGPGHQQLDRGQLRRCSRTTKSAARSPSTWSTSSTTMWTSRPSFSSACRSKPRAWPRRSPPYYARVPTRAVDDLLARPRVQELWKEANRRAHKLFLAVIDDKQGPLAVDERRGRPRPTAHDSAARPTGGLRRSAGPEALRTRGTW